jgi:hypothetical protein
MYHSLYGRLLGHDGSQLLYNQRPLSFSAKGPRGKVVFVDSNVAASDGFSPDTALATLDAAFDKVTANQGDVIYVMPKHAETLSGANGVLQDIAGVSVIGLGEGNQRPTFTYSTSAAATYGITAADSVVENLLFIGNVSNVVAGITTTKSGTKLRKLEFRNAGTNKDFLTPIKHTSTVDNDGDGLEVSDCSWYGNDSDDLEFIEINATLDRFKCLQQLCVQPRHRVAAHSGGDRQVADAGRHRLEPAVQPDDGERAVHLQRRHDQYRHPAQQLCRPQRRDRRA